MIYEDSSLSEELVQSEYRSQDKSEYQTGYKSETTPNKNQFLHTLSDLTEVLYSRIYKNDEDNNKNSNSINSVNYSNNGSYDLLLLCLNTLGAGVSYPPRDRGAPLRASIGGTKILDTCCKILDRSQKRKTQFLRRKATEREEKIAKLAALDLDAERECENTAVSENSNSSGSIGNNSSSSSSSSSSSDNTTNTTDATTVRNVHKNGHNNEHPDQITEEEEREGELVKTALQVLGNLAYGCQYVQVNESVL